MPNIGAQPGALLKLALPLLTLSLALISRESVRALSELQLTLASYLPYLLVIVSASLAFQFNRSRLLLLAGFTGYAFWLIRTELQVPLTEPLANETFRGLALTWPLSIILLLLVPERGILNRWGLVNGALLMVLVAAAPRLLQLLDILLAAQPGWLDIWPRDSIVLPLFSVVLFCVAFLLTVGLLLWRNDLVELALLSTLGAGFGVLAGFHLANMSLVMFIAAGMLQLVAIVGSSHAMAYRDELTGLLGRRALNEKLNGLGPRYSLAMLDVDHFKRFNDTHGHDVGDEVLRLVASRIARVGAGGTPFRYGGEEFCVVFPRKGVEQCVEALEEVREAVADYRLTLRDRGKRPQRVRDGKRRRGSMATRIDSGTVSVTVSIGLAERSEDVPTPEAVIKAADEQLYRAKQSGRNRLRY